MVLTTGKNIRIFKNSFLEKFTFVHPIVPILIWGPVAVFSFLVEPNQGTLTWSQAGAFFLAGLFSWTFVEYFLHRFIFHFNPKSPFQEKVAYFIHGIHHDDPDDQRRLLMPPALALFLAVLFYSIFYTLLGKTDCNPFYSGFVVGYLCYDYIHFATHYFKPKTGLLLTLKRNHLKHHFVLSDKLFGVSSPFWDHIFRTTAVIRKNETAEATQ
jgi:sterol desaturase/sphingolipid hydroxylase (fatty acid hydroxylase superfamily)